jgi:hypothetical protein
VINLNGIVSHQPPSRPHGFSEDQWDSYQSGWFAAVNYYAITSESEALALLRELNDALAIPGWLQPRVDAVLDRAEEKS